jgi:lysozyme
MTPSQKRKTAGVVVAAASLLAFVSGWEGESLPVYADKLAGGLPTVCNGHTGPDVKLGDVWTKEQCDAVLIKNIEKHGEGILACITAPLNQNEYEAYSSLAFNNGVAAVCNSSIPIKLKEGRRSDACNTILEFNKVRDYTKPKIYNQRKKVWEYPLVPVRGLTNRRKAEWAVCVTPVVPTMKAFV